MPDEKTASPATIADLKDIHRGLHVAMDAALKEQDAAKLKVTLHQLDDRMKHLINTLQGVNPGTWF